MSLALLRPTGRGAFVIGSLVLAATASAATQQARVSVSEGSIAPATVKISPGASIEWLNRGKRQHWITSDLGRWPAFALSPGKSRTISFGKAGRYPYHVDGKRRGLVVVGTPPATGKTEPPAAHAGVVKWTGAIISDTTRLYPSGQGSCKDQWYTSLAFALAPNGSLSGTGTATLTGGPTCTKITNHPSLKTIRVRVSGSADSKRFLLRLQEIAHSPGLPAAEWAGFLSVFVKDITAPTIPPTLTIPRRYPCDSGFHHFSTSLVLPTHDRLTTQSSIYLECA